MCAVEEEKRPERDVAARGRQSGEEIQRDEDRDRDGAADEGVVDGRVDKAPAEDRGCVARDVAARGPFERIRLRRNRYGRNVHRTRRVYGKRKSPPCATVA